MNRRTALQYTAALGASLALHKIQAATPASNRVRVAVAGLSRGQAHVAALLKIPGAEIAYIADLDDTRLAKAQKAVAAAQQAPCQAVKDFRVALSDKDVDALFIALPNFWHTPAAIMAMQAGKHVYVEKPGSHNAAEAQYIVEASRKYDRRCQMGNQRRSWPGLVEGIAKLQAGAIGKVHYGRAWYDNKRKAIGQGDIKPSADFDFTLWQGPAPDLADVTKYVHYDWHWRWHWGNGELGNNGVHSLDVLRWGLQPKGAVTASYLGNRYWHKDTQETPDTGSAVFDFGDCGMSWEQSSCHPNTVEKHPTCTFYGEGGSMEVVGNKCLFYDEKGTKTSETTGPGGDLDHITNFLDGIRTGAKLNSDIAEGQGSAMLCHLGNIAYRTRSHITYQGAGQEVPQTAKEYWSRAYRPGWEIKV